MNPCVKRLTKMENSRSRNLGIIPECDRCGKALEIGDKYYRMNRLPLVRRCIPCAKILNLL